MNLMYIDKNGYKKKGIINNMTTLSSSTVQIRERINARKGKFQKFFLYIAILVCTIVIQADAASIEDFSRHSQYYNIKVSPDGKHLAALANVNGTKSLVFFDAETFEITYTLNSGRNSQASAYYWANNERVIIQVEQLRGSLEQPLNYGELFAVNYDGKKRKMIFGYRAESGLVVTGKSGFLKSILKSDKKHVLIQTQEWSRKPGVAPKIVKLNIYNGKTKHLKTAPIGGSQFLVDNEGVPRFVSGMSDDFKVERFYLKDKNSKWQVFGDEFNGEFTPLAFSDDNQSIYAMKGEDGAPQGLYEYNLDTKEETLLYQNEYVDPTNFLRSSFSQFYGVRIDEDYPNYIYIDKNIQEAKLHKALFSAFKGDKVTITSKTKDNTTITVHVSGDRNPGAFYLFDTTTMKARYLFSAASWIKSEDLSPVEPFRITSKDGLALNGFITLPKGKGHNLPTVVLPHGGPHARDYWGYNPQVQMLTNAGYAVVQVNFRGSEGYGQKFVEAGYENWGSKIQDDILLATQYAIQEGIADKNKVCIFGTSFGGYSALQSAINSPELFKCAIGYAGVYDLPMLYEEGDIKSIKWGSAYLDKTLGNDKVKQIEQSPVYHVDKLKAPVLLIHGEDDERAPIKHAEKLRAALDRKDHSYEWLVKDKEGHGFYDEKNILEANKKILSFLKKYIGK